MFHSHHCNYNFDCFTGIPPPPAPPPPPPEILPVITKKFEVTCKVKMRPFHWNKVPVLNVSYWLMEMMNIQGDSKKT